MAEMSLGELPQLLEQLDEAISSRAEEEGARCAHSLANVTGILFAGDIRDAALKIEELVRAGEFAAARRSYRNVVGKCARLMEELQNL
jgi:HPt (histidine-containing phosphotransfer) domain-containing protein